MHTFYLAQVTIKMITRYAPYGDTQDTFSLLLFPTSLAGVNLIDGDHYCPLLESVCAIRPPIHDEDICHTFTLTSYQTHGTANQPGFR